MTEKEPSILEKLGVDIGYKTTHVKTVTEADIILHIRDISHGESEAQKHDVEDILKSLGIMDNDGANIFEVWNKTDLLGPEQREILQNIAARHDNVAMVSALSGQGCDELLSKLDHVLARGKKTFTLKFSHADGGDIALFYKYGEVLERSDSENFTEISVRLDPAAIGQLTKMGQKLEKPDED